MLPRSVRARHRLLPIGEAIQQVHFPSPNTDLAALDHGVTDAHRRLAFEELFLLQAAMALRQRELKEEPGVPDSTPGGILEELARLLPFTLTAAQSGVAGDPVGYGDVQADESVGAGDVGSGKTIVARMRW